MKNLIVQMWPYEVLDDYIQVNGLETAAKLLNYRHKQIYLPRLGLVKHLLKMQLNILSHLCTPAKTKPKVFRSNLNRLEMICRLPW